MRTLMETEHFLAQLSPMVMSFRSSVRIEHPLWAVDEAMQVYNEKTIAYKLWSANLVKKENKWIVLLWCWWINSSSRLHSTKGTENFIVSRSVVCTIVLEWDQSQNPSKYHPPQGRCQGCLNNAGKGQANSVKRKCKGCKQCKVALCEECHQDSTKWDHQSKRAPPVISVA